MNGAASRVVVFVLTLAASAAVTAHHPPKMERCESFSFSGQLVRIEWQRPHVELFVESDEGITYELSWLAINQLGLAGIEQDTLQIGDRVDIVAGVRPNDIVNRPLLLSYIHRNSDGWGWSQTPQGC